MIQVTKGMRDFYPEDYRIREWLFDIFKKAALQSGFELYDSPVVESQELYIRKAGEEITQQLYTFEDKSGRELSLRPEMTPSLARLVIQKFKELPSSIKWSSIPQCFRYERMTRGRKREHFQWNLDFLGEAGVFAEMEVIATAIHAIELMGLDSNTVKVRISNRRLLADCLLALGVDESNLLPVYILIDKLGKVEDAKLCEEMEALGIELDLASQVLELMRSADFAQIQDLIESKNGSTEGISEVKELFELLENYGYGDYLQFDFSIVRGLAYYTGTVFEFFDAGRSLRAIAGGGRYDNLIQNMADADLPEKSKGSITMPAVGFGFGDVVILELLQEKGLVPKLNRSLDYVLIPIGEEQVAYLLPLLKCLRRNGKQVEMYTSQRKLKKLFAQAEKSGAQGAIIAGEQERSEGIVKIKNFSNFEESTLTLEEFIKNAS